MAKEYVLGTSVRVFKWNESLVNNNELSMDNTGLMMFRVVNEEVYHGDGNVCDEFDDDSCIKEVRETHNNEVHGFELSCLRSKDGINTLAYSVLRRQENPFSQKTILALAEEISTSLYGNFQFSLYGPRRNRIVILVDIKMHTIHEEISADEQDHEDNRENIQRCQDAEYCDDNVDASMDLSDDFEEFEEFEEVEYEEIQSENHHMDIEDEEILGEVSDPEILEIRDDLWRCTLEKLPGCICLDPNFSRDSKGFKQVKGAVEIQSYDGEDEMDSCSCCLDSFLNGDEVAKMSCSHLFHGGCISTWLSKKNSCPLCRSSCATFV